MGPDNLVYAAWFSGGLRVINISNPYRPEEVAHYVPKPAPGFRSAQTNDLFVATDGLIYLIGRGEAGRGPLTTQANVRLAASWRHFDLTLDLFNLFDRRDATNIDQIYAGGAIAPIEGGTPEDLIFLKTASGTPAIRRTAYQVGTAFQSPFSAVLGVHRAF